MNEQKVYRIFVASPNDLNPEREALDRVIKELNETWRETLQVDLQIIKWENATYPGFGTDAQAVIEEQIQDKYDIFIGMLWTRFGTATPRSESGTYEEFQKAYKRYVSDNKSIKIMFYFKDEAIPPSKIDGNELERVKAFQKQLSILGGYYWNFIGLSDFERFVRMHLSMQVMREIPNINKAHNLDGIKSQIDESADQLVKTTEVDPDEGFLNLVSKGTEYFEQTKTVTLDIKALIEEFTNRVLQQTDNLNKLGVQNNRFGIAKVTQIIDSFSGDMNHFSTQLNEKRAPFYRTYNSGMEAFGRAMLLLPDFGLDSKEKLTTFLESVVYVKSGLLLLKTSFGNFRDMIEKIPKATTSLSKSKRKTLDTINSFINDFESAIVSTSEIEKSLKRFIS